jgi:hypothetical protein
LKLRLCGHAAWRFWFFTASLHSGGSVARKHGRSFFRPVFVADQRNRCVRSLSSAA